MSTETIIYWPAQKPAGREARLRCMPVIPRRFADGLRLSQACTVQIGVAVFRLNVGDWIISSGRIHDVVRKSEFAELYEEVKR